jgi:dolichyl-phosphate-mannose--protein O-mannosyl transferase
MAARIKLVALLLISLFFITFGVLLLICAYALNNPFEFIITFFAASFIILISAALCLGFVMQLIRLFKPVECENDNRPEPE